MVEFRRFVRDLHRQGASPENPGVLFPTGII
jgi:hypothetical protein